MREPMSEPTSGNSHKESSFPADLAELRSIRRFVEAESRKSGLSEERIFDLAVAVSEACANAIEHSCDPGRLQLTVRGETGEFVVEILHPGRMRPGNVGKDNLHRGLGLSLMASLADRLTITNLREGGTSVSLSMFLA